MKRFITGLTYGFSRNIGLKDKIIRTLAASALITGWFFGIATGVLGIVLFVFAIMLLGTVASSRCGVTYWLDGNTMSTAEKEKLDNKGIKYE